MATEKLKFKLELYATMWDKPPHAEIMIGDKSYFTKDITDTEDKPGLIEFEAECEENKDYDLIIKRSGKGNNQTVINEKGDVLKDQLLHIKSIEIDEIDIGALVYEGVYTPKYPEPWATQQREAGVELRHSFKNVTAMGHNGEWRLTFSSPFYMWLLENLY
jgi:chaperonin GroEL (HSP60 family)|tara:strand:+ start:181 stop:663 length:483 start_codon:yes stop_codon:yes gene_type:complete